MPGIDTGASTDSAGDVLEWFGGVSVVFQNLWYDSCNFGAVSARHPGCPYHIRYITCHFLYCDSFRMQCRYGGSFTMHEGNQVPLSCVL